MDSPDFTFIEKEDVLPKCPHCGVSLNEVYFRGKGLGFIQARHSLFFCPHCLKILGISTTAMM